jgi:hypothetical protein
MTLVTPMMMKICSFLMSLPLHRRPSNERYHSDIGQEVCRITPFTTILLLSQAFFLASRRSQAAGIASSSTGAPTAPAIDLDSDYSTDNDIPLAMSCALQDSMDVDPLVIPPQAVIPTASSSFVVDNTLENPYLQGRSYVL